LIINKQDMQGFGSALTYARRYGIMAAVGVATEDDDGVAAGSDQKPKNSKDDPAWRGPLRLHSRRLVDLFFLILFAHFGQ